MPCQYCGTSRSEPVCERCARIIAYHLKHPLLAGSRVAKRLKLPQKLCADVIHKYRTRSKGVTRRKDPTPAEIEAFKLANREAAIEDGEGRKGEGIVMRHVIRNYTLYRHNGRDSLR